MSQGHSVESSTRPSPAQSINPALQAALGSLDVQLEEELSRYRRERGGRGASPAPRMNHDRVRNKPIDLISVSATGGRNQSPAPAKPPASPPPPPPPPASPPQAANLEGKGVETTIQNETGYTPPAPAPSFDLSAPGAELATFATPPQEPAWHPEPAAEPPEFVNPTSTHVPPNDYLESSEQLLRSLVEEEASAPRRSERSFLDSLLTPLGVGSLLLLLFSTATLGYLVTNPGSLSFLGLDRFQESGTPTVAQNPTATTPTATTPTATTPTTNAPAAGAAPSGPNLATDEFVDVNLDTLSTLPSSSPASRSNVAGLPKTQVAVPTISPLPSSPAPANSSSGQSGSVPLPGLPPAATVPLTPASPLPGLPQRPASGQPSIQPSVKPSPTAATPAPNPEGFYYVFVKYNGESSLQQARKVVPDAYLSPEGTQIYLGAFKKESQAQTLVKELQTQGISAAVDQP
ncbi:SPOR domain-containing protein [Coleofasciculus sp. FACHB-SPT36]|uniref:SPOR domain-containing protein n=1 Tax=Cyanophyceae TaxID=3028117 RepID=UPI00168B4C28|nr:SPOR domain-containing protein [Coleofasciculus sp. FACHB-SPT36]MBD2538334.1 hypothetical protein [Coleofasciculus sp. FACHB-SPT36]